MARFQLTGAFLLRCSCAVPDPAAREIVAAEKTVARLTADVDGEATALFITAGDGTEHRPR